MSLRPIAVKERAGNTVAACQPQFPQLPFQVLHVRLA